MSALGMLAGRCWECTIGILRMFDVYAGNASLHVQVRLASLGCFDHGRGSTTLWLNPESPSLESLQAKLAAAFPSCQDLNQDPARGITTFQPHLSLGQWPSASRADAALKATPSVVPRLPLSTLTTLTFPHFRVQSHTLFGLGYINKNIGGYIYKVIPPYI